ncbi:hypothetical protein LCGC14_2828550 [marine sediment metagenome]|uniref:Uncharacterized protein n=1 Tax=marine sediment metagenome TaxID=412755 RepID=A0A0F9B5X9_9ZZZZ
MKEKNKPGIVIGTKKEAIWTNVKEKTEQRIEIAEENLGIDKELIKLAEKIIAEEKGK